MKKNLAKKVYVLILILVIIMLLNSFLTVYIPNLLQYGLDNILSKKYKLIFYIVLATSFFFGFKYVVSILQNYLSNLYAWNIGNKIRIELLKKIKDGCLNDKNEFTLGSFYEYIETDVKNIQNYFSNTLISIINQCIVLVFILLFIFKKSEFFFWVILIYTFMVLLLLIFVALKKDNDVILKEREQATQAFSKYSQILQGKRDLRILNEYEYVDKKIIDIDNTWLLARKKAQHFLYQFWSITVTVSTLFQSISLLIGGIVYVKGAITIGEVYLLFMYSGLLSEPLKNVQAYIQRTISFHASCKRIKQMLHKKPSVISGCMELLTLESISIKHVSFTYDKSKYVLHDFNLEMHKNECIGIFGTSGCGKTTLSKLLTKQIDFTEGEITFNDHSLHNYSMNSIRKQVAYVKANDTVFHTSIYNNLTIFNTDITHKYIKEVLSELHLPVIENLDMYVNEELFTKEQIQYLNLLRLLFQKKQFIIFDEAVSAIDVNYSDTLFKVLNKIKKDKIVIIISHNKDHLLICDKYVNLNEYNKREDN